MNELIKFAEMKGFNIKQKPLKSSDGLLVGCRIAIRNEVPDQDYILAHELAHAYLHRGDTVSDPLHDLYEVQADRGARLILDLVNFMKGAAQ